MVISQKRGRNSHLPKIVAGMVALIKKWRQEISEKKDLAPNLNTLKLETLLHRIEQEGVPLLLAAYTILACEWVFRVRQPTEEDIQNEFEGMIANLSKPSNGALTEFQARLLIQANERAIRKQLKGFRIPVAIGFSTPGWHPQWFGQQKTRTADQLIAHRRGPFPTLGPILAGLTIEALAEEKKGSSARQLGQDVCAVLFPRKILDFEYQFWKATAVKIPDHRNYTPTPRRWLAAQVRRDYELLIERDKMTLEELLGRCNKDPENFFTALLNRDLIFSLYQQRWGKPKPKKSK